MAPPSRAERPTLHAHAGGEAALHRLEQISTAVREHVEFGTRVAMQNSNATSDEELHPLRTVPLWNWPDET
jgi:hemoglobin